jgi:anthranilate synthase/aminodeoxychorismate synthase-like glutamine amidotransferase
MSVLLLNNHDSFTWNLFELLRRIGKINIKIVTPEKLRISDLAKYNQIIFSPGPGLPHEQPAMFDVLQAVEKLMRHRAAKISVFGVCLGMQAIAQYFGGKLVNLPRVVHGQPRKLTILRPDHPFFSGIPEGSEVGLYHSWAVDPATLPECLEILAITQNGTIMALAHKTLPIAGVQFHPESIMTPLGTRMMQNWFTT